MSSEYSEDRLVQQTTANFFEQTLKWHSVYAYKKETFGINRTLGRKDKREVVLTRYLRQALEKFNPGHPQQVYDDAIAQFTTSNISDQLVTINHKKYQLLREGILEKPYKNPEGETINPRLKVIDFQNPENNHFLIVRELSIKGSLYSKRPDIIGFVNGIPLLFIELKATYRNVRVAYEDNYTDYKDTIPEIFHHNAIVMLSNGIVGKVGSITSRYGHFQEWKRLEEEELGKVDYQTMLIGMCRKDNFLDIIENFILFDDSSGKTIKILTRNHQFLGVNRAFTAIQQRQVREGKLGVFWHTQGSGKSYSTAFLTRKAHRQLPGNFTFVIVTDRQELDNQIVKTFAGVGAIKENNTQAASGEKLAELLKDNHRYVFTLIHKFNKPGEIYSLRPDIIVISDEAHRTQYGKLAENMRSSLPNASFIGFTGTPLMESEEDQLTRRVFGGYVSTYDFQRAVVDGATVPLYYDNRGEELYYEDKGTQRQVAADEELNQRLVTAIEQFDLDAEQEEAVRRRLGGEYLILTAEKRLNRIAEDLVAHYTQRWQTGKAMLVCLDKITAVRMHGLIDKYWKQAIQAQIQLVKQATDEQEEVEHQQHLQWLQSTEYLVVISEAQNEVKTFKDWGLDIIPHRQIIKSRNLEEEFKNEKHPFRLAIVCAMWLTGFDVPSLATLYIDKPLQGHTLMQAIARANRVYEGKNNGLLIDYNGILTSLRAALATYSRAEVGSEDESITPYNDLNQLQEDYAKSGKNYDISKIDFESLKAEFANSPTKNTSVQTLKEAVERQLQRMIQQNPSRIDYYTRYQQVIQNYNRETDRVAIEQTFEELLKLVYIN
ncbi:MAG: type I restriction endonuclease subunit R [Nostoc sp.]|uniref:type I restriction endonuclease subunit R n=1 Tax=Nostoc sp. TaxID=1180 RepID=UPI002FF510A4